MMAADNDLLPRHIQDHPTGTFSEPHWGYNIRVVPCTSDKLTCEYLDVVYSSHDRGIFYVGIFWATIAVILLGWAVGRHFMSSSSQSFGVQLPVEEEEMRSSRSTSHRIKNALSVYKRRYLLPDAARRVFGRVTRLQVLTLAILAGYLVIWSFVGITYNKWMTPVKKQPGLYSTRTSLGPWSDRVGVLAYALTPLAVMLSSRESVLSLLTGLPYQSFNFLHQWLGYIIFAQSALHTIGWCVIEIRLYQPQPQARLQLITEKYMIWGIAAMALLTALVLLSTPWGIRATGYEFFRKAHYILAMVYIGACWAHWRMLEAFLWPGLIIWLFDRTVRLIRTALLHYNYLPSGHKGFRALSAQVTFFKDASGNNGDVVRLDFDHPQDAWDVGQHFYLTFPESSIWQSHPFTPLSLPVYGAEKQRHSYVFRAKKGETKKIAAISEKHCMSQHDQVHEGLEGDARLSVILTGPYGERILSKLSVTSNVLCVAGGTGITYVLPVLLYLAQAGPQMSDRQISLIWVVRHRSHLAWVAPELAILKQKNMHVQISIHVYVTRASEEGALTGDVPEKEEATSSSKEIQPVTSSETSLSPSALSLHGVGDGEARLNHYQARPNLNTLVPEFVAGTVRGKTDVFASGPGGMLSDLRDIVARLNMGHKAWQGDSRFDVNLTCDDRLEW